MATHSSILAWKIPWTEKPGGLQSMGSQRVRHDLATNTKKVVSAPGKTRVRQVCSGRQDAVVSRVAWNTWWGGHGEEGTRESSSP